MIKEEQFDEEMTVDITLENNEVITCAIITILEVEGKDYIVLLPLDENGNNDDGEVWFYGYSENPDDPNEEPILEYIADDDEYEAVADAFDEYLEMGILIPKEPTKVCNEIYEKLKQSKNRYM